MEQGAALSSSYMLAVADDRCTMYEMIRLGPKTCLHLSENNTILPSIHIGMGAILRKVGE